MNNGNGFVSRLTRIVSLILGLCALGWLLIQAGMMLQEQKTSNTELRELNTTMRALTSRMTVLESARDDLQRLGYAQVRQLGVLEDVAKTSAQTLQRHIQEEKTSRWYVYQRLNALDHLGAGGGKR